MRTAKGSPRTNHIRPSIQVRHWQVEVGDDPFEVKLRYNYELLEDEYQEGCKRLKALDSRVSQRSCASSNTTWPWFLDDWIDEWMNE